MSLHESTRINSFGKQSVFTTRQAKIKLKELELPHLIHQNVLAIIKQHQNLDKFAEKGLTPKDKIFLEGASGTGKTSSVEAIASELKRPYKLFKLDTLSPTDATTAFDALNRAFDEINQEPPAVYVFDEFDAISGGRQKGINNPILRAITNKLIEHFDNKNGYSILVCTTNHSELVDAAFKTRFDTICRFENPSITLREKAIRELLKIKLSFATDDEIKHAAEKTEGLSFREISNLIQDSIKRTIIEPEYNPEEGILFTPELANVEIRRQNHKEITF